MVAGDGAGRKKLEKQVEELESKFPKKVKGVVKFSAPLAHQITAGSESSCNAYSGVLMDQQPPLPLPLQMPFPCQGQAQSCWL